MTRPHRLPGVEGHPAAKTRPRRWRKSCTVPASTIRKNREGVRGGRADRRHHRDRGQDLSVSVPRLLITTAARNPTANGLFDNMTFKLFNMLVGNIDVPGGHLGVPLDHRGFFVSPARTAC